MSCPWRDDEEIPDSGPGGLILTELFWKDHVEWLKDCGYRLRARYQPSWAPPSIWSNSKKYYYPDYEDGQVPRFGHLLDAVRVSDGAFVMLKQVKYSHHPFEAEIGQFLSSPPLSTAPDNHCLSFSESIPIPGVEDWSLIVMPLLRRFDNPRFDNFGETIDFFGQVFQGLRFMHRNYVAHRDINSNNIMMDATPLYPEPYHPVDIVMKRDWSGHVRHLTRTQHPVKYFFIDFGLSRRYGPHDEAPLEDPIIGGDKSVPEFQDRQQLRNPYHTDVYCMGNLLRTEFLQKMYGFDFIGPLVSDMVLDDPSARPSMDVVVERFDAIVATLPGSKLRSRIRYRDEAFLTAWLLELAHWARRFGLLSNGPRRDSY